MILDLPRQQRPEGSADPLSGVDLAAALPTALSRWTDWNRTDRTQQSVGLAHTAANISGVLLFTASLGTRRRGARHRVSRAGTGSMGAVTYLGGHVSLAPGAGVGERS